MIKRSTILLLGFLAGLAGNLVAGWIQQDIWQGIFTPTRLIATIIGASLMLLTIVWLEKRSGSEAKPKAKKGIQRVRRPNKEVVHMANPSGVDKYDVFISHASEDKDDFVRPLAEALTKKNFSVWYDEFEVDLGDSLREEIDRGLASSRYGVVVLSPSFLQKDWPIRELNGLFARESRGRKVILPIWHKITRSEVLAFSPMLADKYALSTQDMSLEQITASLAKVLEQ